MSLLTLLHAQKDSILALARHDLFDQRLALVEALETLLHRKIDLIPEHELNPHIAADILQEAVGL
jgi:hypothetical protein